MRRIETALPGVCLLEPDVYQDARGFFLETYHEAKFRELGITSRFVQDNHSGSARGTLRGLHYQRRRGQAKLCRVVRGEALDVVADIRRGSPTFGKWIAVALSEQNRRQIFIPVGFAHGFLARTDATEFLYKCDQFYDPQDERGIRWDDPQLGIDWDWSEPPLLSVKDAALPLLSALDQDDLPAYRPDTE